MKSGGGPNDNQGGQKKKSEKFGKFYKNLRAVAREKLFPCVVFSFSRN